MPCKSPVQLTWNELPLRTEHPTGCYGQEKYGYSHFRDEETEVQREEGSCLKSHSWIVDELGLGSKSVLLLSGLRVSLFQASIGIQPWNACWSVVVGWEITDLYTKQGQLGRKLGSGAWLKGPQIGWTWWGGKWSHLASKIWFQGQLPWVYNKLLAPCKGKVKPAPPRNHYYPVILMQSVVPLLLQKSLLQLGWAFKVFAL